jgi:hypothetical protein
MTTDELLAKWRQNMQKQIDEQADKLPPEMRGPPLFEALCDAMWGPPVKAHRIHFVGKFTPPKEPTVTLRVVNNHQTEGREVG